ncbi:hypothetical protein [Streptomyces tauricus]|uniref:hypothetical protein n=1 Tax=Streptomyces tauricus TaxID=68274 RepID=UPI003449381F
MVSYSSWGVGTDLSVIPQAWRRAGTATRKPVWSRQDFWENFRTHPAVFVARVNFESVTGFLSGYDVAVSGNLLDGFREWLAAKLGFGRNLVWFALILKLVFPEGRPAEPWSQEDDQHAVNQLIKLLDEYFESRAGDPEAAGERRPSRPPS